MTAWILGVLKGCFTAFHQGLGLYGQSGLRF